MKILIIDNYDSFTYNLYQVCGELLLDSGREFVTDVIRNNRITVQEIKKRRYNRIILSPGPGDPSDRAYFGVCADILLTIGKTIPVLGVCLGMQGMAHYYGGKVVKAEKPMHGKTSVIVHSAKGLFDKVPQNIEVMRYHSLIVQPESLPECLEVTAIVKSAEVGTQNFSVPQAKLDADKKGHDANTKNFDSSPRLTYEIMGVMHKKYPIVGVQFHPESFATDAGKAMLKNFLFAKSKFKSQK